VGWGKTAELTKNGRWAAKAATQNTKTGKIAEEKV